MTLTSIIIIALLCGLGAVLLYINLSAIVKISDTYDYIKKQRTDVDKIGDYMYQRAKDSGNMCSFSSDLDDELSERVGVDKHSKAAIIISELKKAYYPNQEQNGIVEAKKDLDILEKVIYNIVCDYERKHDTHILYISMVESAGFGDTHPKTVGVKCEKGIFSAESKNKRQALADLEVAELSIFNEVKSFEDKYSIRIIDIQSYTMEHVDKTVKITCATSLKYTA